MANESPHISLANRNQITLQCLIEHDRDHSEWITVVAFYKALHVVEAVFAKGNMPHGRNHESREMLLKRERKFKQIYKHYRPLWAASTIARYLAAPGGREYRNYSVYISPDDVVPKMVNHYLNKVEQSAMKFLGDDCGLVRCA